MTVMKAMEKAFNTFENQHTYWRLSQEGKEDEFDAKYEQAVEEVRSGLLGRDVPLMINGEAVQADGWIERHSPTDTRMLVSRVPKATKEHAKQAIQAAKAGYDDWRHTPWQERADLLDKTADLYVENFYELCAIMGTELGKNRFEASIDADEAIDFLRFYALKMREFEGFDMEMGRPYPNERCRSVMKPYGVFSVMGPFNFPVAITTGMTAAALVTGNTAIMKPSLKGALAGIRCYELMREAGIPASALQFAVGPDETVSTELTSNPDVDGVIFTGSKKIGFEIQRRMAEQSPSKPVITEMGGKNAIIVTKNADLEKAVEGSYRAAFGAQGQKCSAGSRLLVDKAVIDEFLRRLVERTRDTVVDQPWKKEAFMGPIVEEYKYKQYQEVAKRIKKEGKILTGGEVLTQGDLKQGYYVTPLVGTGLPRDHDFFREELFMPVTVAWEVDGIEDAVKAANAVDFGLTAGIFTEDKKEQDYFFDHIEAGTTYCNRKTGGSTAAVVNGQAFGGWKASGSTGRGAGARYYLQQFMREHSQTRVVD
jgi:1-pyrroline-5-carboxylate dehydrogenase